MKYIKYLLVAVVSASVINCSQQNNVTNIDKPVVLQITKEQKINNQLFITYSDLIEDSRCPKDVDCVWEGLGIAELEIRKDNSIKKIKIATRDFESTNAKQTVELDGYSYKLIDMKPYPGGEIVENMITVKIEKL